MDNLTDFQKTVLDKLLPQLKNTQPEKELKRICNVYKELIENEDDEYLYETFCKTIESNLFLVLKEKPEFYTLDYFQQEYNDLITDYADIDEDDYIWIKLWDSKLCVISIFKGVDFPSGQFKNSFKEHTNGVFFDNTKEFFWITHDILKLRSNMWKVK